MLTEHRAVAALRAVLVLLFAVLVFSQVVSLPGEFAAMAEESPDLAGLRWPLTAVTVFLVLCVQVVIVCTRKLLTLVQEDRIFTDESLVWVDGIVGAVAAAWVVLAGLSLWVAVTATDPAVPLMIGLVDMGVTVLGLLMVVMRTLLRRATSLRSDLEEVI